MSVGGFLIMISYRTKEPKTPDSPHFESAPHPQRTCLDRMDIPQRIEGWPSHRGRSCEGTAQEGTGNSSISITQRYVHPQAETIDRVFAKALTLQKRNQLEGKSEVIVERPAKSRFDQVHRVSFVRVELGQNPVFEDMICAALNVQLL